MPPAVEVANTSFEDINFRLDKISNRITKTQKDNQIRFQDLETGTLATEEKSQVKKKKKLPTILRLG